jgi:hypothetical protein
MMGVCLLLIVLAWTVVYRYSGVAAVAMSAVALVVPPFAAIIANSGSDTSQRLTAGSRSLHSQRLATTAAVEGRHQSACSVPRRCVPADRTPLHSRLQPCPG